jgi:hypothetical protein
VDTPKNKQEEGMKRILLISIFILFAMFAGLFPLNKLESSTDTGKLIFILDASGSMWEKIQGGTKIEIAKEVLSGIFQKLPANVDAGLYAYGHRSKGDCNDIEELVPLGPANKQQLVDKIKSLDPKGMTPITASIRVALEKLKTVEQESTVLLVSDGKETCKGDPCALVKELKKSGIKFVMHVVGFNVTAEEKAQLECIAAAGGGQYFTASDAKGFEIAAQKVAGSVGISDKPGSIKLDKKVYSPLEEIKVTFTADKDYADDAWLGTVPSKVAHDNEAESDRFHIVYEYLRKKTSGTIKLKAPKDEGDFDVRMFNSDIGGKETAFAPFQVKGKLALGSLQLDKTTYAPGEKMTVRFTAPTYFDKNAWIGVVPSSIAHNSENESDKANKGYEYIQGKTEGTFTFLAPAAKGSYDIRMFDSENDGKETTSVTFTVTGEENKSTLKLNKTAYSPGEQIVVQFTAPASFAEDAWIGIIPSGTTHGDEKTCDEVNMGYEYVKKQVSGTVKLTAPGEPGKYDIRMFDTDYDGKEVASVSFTVK